MWSPDVQSYTRMFYARYGRGPPGQTPWRLGKGLRPRFSDKQSISTTGLQGDTNTFLTAAHTEIQKYMPHTSIPLWQQYCSGPIATVDLDFVRKWAIAMRPRSIHDLKPMLMLCQGLLKDISELCLHTEQALRTDLQCSFDEKIAQIDGDARREIETMQRRLDSMISMEKRTEAAQVNVKAASRTGQGTSMSFGGLVAAT